MQRYEFRMKIIDEEYVDSLIVALTRQGYAPYLSPDGEVCIGISDDELTDVEGCNHHGFADN